MNVQKLKTIEIFNNTKAPLKKWLETKNQFKGRPTTTTNYGILTGKANNIIVIDCDFYKTEKKEHKVLEIFKEYKKDLLNTYTVLTPRNGLHYYFKYDAEIKNAINDKYNIDIKSDGGYVLGAGSKINNKEYKVLYDREPATIPANIKNWILHNLYTAEKKRKLVIKEKQIIKKDVNNNIVNEYNINRKELKKIINKLDNKYWTMNNNGFLKFTTFCKYFNIKDLWDEINKTKPNYNYEKNINHFWNTAQLSGEKLYNIIDSILYEAGNNTYIYTAYSKYRPVPKNTIQPDLILNKKDLVKGKYLNSSIIERKTNYMIKSDTGTGKTTLFKKYIKENNEHFISIVSRVSLANEQYRVFNEYGIQDIKHYNYDKYGTLNNFNIVIQIDSLLKLRNFDFSNYVIFLDEVNSIIHHLITSPTLNDKSAIVYKLFIKILKEAKQIIGTDADINDTSLNFLKPLFNYKYIQNTKKHNEGVKATEIKNLQLFIEKLKKEKCFIVATDSATVAEHISTELKKNIVIDINNVDDKDNIKLITSYTTQNDLDLDEHNKIIFSPKILYGLDSKMERPVYCYYKEHTINPTAYIQQISRCRNITHLYYTFESKAYKHIMTTKQDLINNVSDDHILIEKLYSLKTLLTDREYKHYLCSYISYEYINICYDSNKFSHFLKLLLDRGFILKSSMFQIEKTDRKKTKKALKESREQKLLTFNYNDYPIKHKSLGIPDENKADIEKYKEYYINDYLLTEHKNIIKTITHTEHDIKQKIQRRNGTKNTIMASNDNKIFLECCQINLEPSGISITKSDYIIFFSYFNYWIVKTEKVKKLLERTIRDILINNNIPNPTQEQLLLYIEHEAIKTKNTIGILINVDDVIKICKYKGTHKKTYNKRLF